MSEQETQYPDRWEGVTATTAPATLTGVIVDGREAKSEFGEFQVVDVRREDGTVLSVPTFRNGLKRALQAAEGRGELGLGKPITITLAEKLTTSDGRPFYRYEINGQDGGVGSGRRASWAQGAEEMIPQTAEAVMVGADEDDKKPLPF